MYNHQVKTGVKGSIIIPKTRIRKICELLFSPILKKYYWSGIPGLFDFFISIEESLKTIESFKKYNFELEGI